MTLNADQWQQVTNISAFLLGTGDSDPNNLYWYVAAQMGQDVAADIASGSYGGDVYNWIIDRAWRGRQNGLSNEQISAQIATEVSPWVWPDQPQPVGGELTAQQRSAKANLDGFLADYGLQSLGDYVWQEYLNNIPIEQIMLDIRSRPEYEQRFPAMKKLGQEGYAISESEYIGYERSAIELMRVANMPPGFYDNPADFQALLENHVSISELQARVTQEYTRVANTAPEIRDYFSAMFGVDSGDAALAAIYLDPDKALGALHKMSSAAAFGGISTIAGEQVGFGTAQSAAEAGIDESAARSGFQRVAQLHPLEFGTLGEGAGLTADQLASGVFGFGPGAEAALARRLEERAGEFAGSKGGPLDTSQGTVGLGTSGRTRR